MANDEDLARLRQGPAAWNAWRAQNPERRVDLREADLREADLRGADLEHAILAGANLQWANLAGANLAGADLREAEHFISDPSPGRWGEQDAVFRLLMSVKANLAEANLHKADLRTAKLFGANLAEANLGWANLQWANLAGADLREADLRHADMRNADLEHAILAGANLQWANLAGANLAGANFTCASLIGTNLTDADLTGCRVYGISAWDLKLEGTKQRDLVITVSDHSQITVDNIEVGQFIYLLLHNEKIRSVIDTITSKVVLILGRFTPKRKAVLDALRKELRKSEYDYVPVVFDFENPASKDLTGTVSTLANMARFIIADLTDPSSIPHELATVIPNTVVPVQPVLLAGESEYAMFVGFRRRYSWVLATHHYTSPEQLIADLSERVIGPAEAKVHELRGG